MSSMPQKARYVFRRVYLTVVHVDRLEGVIAGHGGCMAGSDGDEEAILLLYLLLCTWEPAWGRSFAKEGARGEENFSFDHRRPLLVMMESGRREANVVLDTLDWTTVNEFSARA